ncbi:MAG: tetratricopeptide repeat protein [Bacteroidetes bacterium]|jgi:tetratricopeptide (TPR) repeat protein|nr:tetratricopeptide repeat protein [Bacteroidota bacterium]
MHEKEIQLFTLAIQLAKDEFYLDTIKFLEQLIEEFKESELVDDALYNIGLCYFNMNQFEKAIELFQQVVYQYPDATISILDGGNEFGKTAAKCHYATMNCFLGMGRLDLALDILNSLDDFPDSYIVIDSGDKRTFKELAENALDIYKLQSKK